MLATDVIDKKKKQKKLLQFLTFHINQMFQQFLALGFKVKWLVMGMWQQNASQTSQKHLKTSLLACAKTIYGLLPWSIVSVTEGGVFTG